MNIKSIMENWNRFLIEEQTQDKFVLAACAIFASKYIKGKEGQQLPVSLLANTRQEVDDYFTGGKPGKKHQFKRGKEGAITEFTTTISHNKHGDRDVKHIKRLYISKRNQMNHMLDALSTMLLFGKGRGSNPLDRGKQNNPYYQKIMHIAQNIQKGVKGQYDVDKHASIAAETVVMGDSFLESELEHRRKEQVRSISEAEVVTGGSLGTNNLLSTTVDYLVGPLGTHQPGTFAGIQKKAKAQHDKLANAFGDKGVLGAVRQAFSHKDLGGDGLDDESPGEFKRRLDRSMGGGPRGRVAPKRPTPDMGLKSRGKRVR